jgi:hypothetical protein
MAFERNVFVTCPFDPDYYPLLRPLLFTVIYLGLDPRFALEDLDSADARIRKILRIIKESKYGIHDLSRLQATKRGEYYRLNMPFELGLDVGARLFNRGKLAGKRCLVRGKEPFRYQAAISDLAGSDIAVHSGEPSEVIGQVRNWLSQQIGWASPGPTKIWEHSTTSWHGTMMT